MMKEVNRSLPLVWVDADACPVKEEIITVAKKFSLNIRFVASVGLKKFQNRKGIDVVKCEVGQDAADQYILENTSLRDLVLCTDLLMARKLIKKGVAVCGFKGTAFTEENIGEALAHRAAVLTHLEAGHRSAPQQNEKKSTDQIKSSFKNNFHNFIFNHLKA